MKVFIFGMDQKEPVSCAKMLRERGIEAVVAGSFSAEAAAALKAEGIDMYLCYGAYGIGKDSARLAQDPCSQPRRWFNSGCPNDRENAEKHLNAVLEKASLNPDIKGILVDGARFASFASVEGIESFFTCFCPRCMRAMADMGLPAGTIRSAVSRLMESRCLSENDAPLIRQWMHFREKTVQQYMDDFAARVHSLRGDLLAGAFIFAPSLGQYVGQTMEACRSLDVVSHMLYRDYPHEFGVACLGHEWSALVSIFHENVDGLLQLTNAPFSTQRSADDLRQNGFPPEWVGSEVAKAADELRPGQLLWPILQLQDARLHETAKFSFESGARAVGLFAYGHAEVPHF